MRGLQQWGQHVLPRAFQSLPEAPWKVLEGMVLLRGSWAGGKVLGRPVLEVLEKGVRRGAGLVLFVPFG